MIQNIIMVILIVILLVYHIIYRYKFQQIILKQQEELRKAHAYWLVLNQWLRFKQEGKAVAKSLLLDDIHTIAIYGYGDLGKRLLDELRSTEVTVEYIIDKNVDDSFSDKKIYKPSLTLPKVDAIVITATYYYNEIEKDLETLVDYPIISIEDLIL